VAREIAAAAPAFSSHIWRAAAAGNLHGWQITRALWMLNVLTGSVGTPGGVSANAWNKFIPAPWKKPTANEQWNELNWPREYPLAHNEMSILYPHFLLDRDRGSQAVLFTRVLNPVWTYPDGYSWLRALRDEAAVGLHGAMTPTWSETAWWADYVLPMGHGPERHDTHSYETHAGRWLGFRQPVQRVAMQRAGREVQFTYEANPGEVWEEGEFWIEVSWLLRPGGRLITVTAAIPPSGLGRPVAAALDRLAARRSGRYRGLRALNPASALARAGLRLLRSRWSLRGYPASACWRSGQSTGLKGNDRERTGRQSPTTSIPGENATRPLILRIQGYG